MTQLLEWAQRLLSGPSLGQDLESFINSKYPKTHADVEYWSKYWEFRGL